MFASAAVNAQAVIRQSLNAKACVECQASGGDSCNKTDFSLSTSHVSLSVSSTNAPYSHLY
jgi:hypothetical protein